MELFDYTVRIWNITDNEEVVYELEQTTVVDAVRQFKKWIELQYDMFGIRMQILEVVMS